MKAFIVGISLSVEDFREVVADVPGVRLLRELRPGQVVVVCDEPVGKLGSLRGVEWVRADEPRHMDEGPGARPDPS